MHYDRFFDGITDDERKKKTSGREKSAQPGENESVSE